MKKEGEKTGDTLGQRGWVGSPRGQPQIPTQVGPGPPAGLTLPHPCRGLAGRSTASGGPSRDPQISLSGHWWDIIGVGTVRLLGAGARPLVPSDRPLSERLRKKPSPPRPSPQGALGILLRPWGLLPDQPWATCTRLPPPTMNGASRGLSLPGPPPPGHLHPYFAEEDILGSENESVTQGDAEKGRAGPERGSSVIGCPRTSSSSSRGSGSCRREAGATRTLALPGSSRWRQWPGPCRARQGSLGAPVFSEGCWGHEVQKLLKSPSLHGSKTLPRKGPWTYAGVTGRREKQGSRPQCLRQTRSPDSKDEQHPRPLNVLAPSTAVLMLLLRTGGFSVGV